MKHTPGPWEVVNGKDVFTKLGGARADGMEADANDGWQIADCVAGSIFVDGEEYELPFAEQRANARVIAAAPDLLAAGMALVAEIVLNDDEGLAQHSEAIAAMRAAIAKATGEGE